MSSPASSRDRGMEVRVAALAEPKSAGRERRARSWGGPVEALAEAQRRRRC